MATRKCACLPMHAQSMTLRLPAIGRATQRSMQLMQSMLVSLTAILSKRAQPLQTTAHHLQQHIAGVLGLGCSNEHKWPQRS